MKQVQDPTRNMSLERRNTADDELPLLLMVMIKTITLVFRLLQRLGKLLCVSSRTVALYGNGYRNSDAINDQYSATKSNEFIIGTFYLACIHGNLG